MLIWWLLVSLEPSTTMHKEGIDNPLGFSSSWHIVKWAWWCMPVIPALRRWRQEDKKLGAGEMVQ